MARRYEVIVEWTDGDVADADEVVVSARSAREAISAARIAWSATKGAEWPYCRISRILILTKRMMRCLE